MSGASPDSAGDFEAGNPEVPSGNAHSNQLHLDSHRHTDGGVTQSNVGALAQSSAQEGDSPNQSATASEVFSGGNSLPETNSESSTPPAVPTQSSVAINSSNTASENETTENADAFVFRCALVPDCTTGSSARKAVSHFFGRNKSCTLSIPDYIWLYYCRKHYQRVRYRTGSDYAKTQIGLVYDQLNKLLEWSDANRAARTGPYIMDWTVTLRKRAREGLDGHQVNAVPNWVIQSTGEGKSDQFVREILSRIRRDLESGIIEDIPEIEFLPNVVDSMTLEPTKARKVNKRKANKPSDSRETAGRADVPPRKKSKGRQPSNAAPQAASAAMDQVRAADTVSSQLPPINTLPTPGVRLPSVYNVDRYNYSEPNLGSAYETRGRSAVGLPPPRPNNSTTAVPPQRYQAGAGLPQPWAPSSGNNETVVNAGYVNHPDFENPMPGSAYARQERASVYRDGEG